MSRFRSTTCGVDLYQPRVDCAKKMGERCNKQPVGRLEGCHASSAMVVTAVSRPSYSFHSGRSAGQQPAAKICVRVQCA
jgi:hypothetical protein